MIVGNDEFILHIRKNHKNCQISNDHLGKKIWHHIKELDPNARIRQTDKPCYWGSIGSFISEKKLPKTATQLSFDPAILPQIYDYLSVLGLQ